MSERTSYKNTIIYQYILNGISYPADHARVVG